jgi:hypothetical protein
MIDQIVMLTPKFILFLGSTGYLMFAQLPTDIPLNADKSIALGIAVWALIATKRELTKSNEKLDKAHELFQAEIKEERSASEAKTQEERSRSDKRLDTLDNLVTAINTTNDRIKSCPHNKEL